MENRANIVKCILVIIPTGIIIYLMNYYTGLYCDDYSYSFSFATGERITEFKQIIPSIVEHYNTVNGRFFTHILAQVFLLVGKPVFNIINTIAFITLGLLIAFYKNGAAKDIRYFDLAFIYSAIIFVAPKFSQSFLWIDGSANYLFGIIIVLLFLVPYRKILYLHNNYIKILFCFAMFIAGIVGGNTNENTSVAAIILIISIIIIIRVFEQNKIPVYFWFGLVGSIIGFCGLIISPGELSRLASSGGVYSMFAGIVKNFIFVTLLTGEYLGALLVLFIVLIVNIIIIRFSCNINQEKAFNKYCAIISEMKYEISFIVCFLVSVYSLILSPSHIERVFTGPMCLLIICILICASKIKKYKKERDRIVTILRVSIVACVFVSLCIAGNGLFDLRTCNRDYNIREAMILEQKNQGINNIKIFAIESDSKFCTYRYSGDLVYDKEAWPNTDMAKYYGVKSISRDDSKAPEH